MSYDRTRISGRDLIDSEIPALFRGILFHDVSRATLAYFGSTIWMIRQVFHLKGALHHVPYAPSRMYEDDVIIAAHAAEEL